VVLAKYCNRTVNQLADRSANVCNRSWSGLTSYAACENFHMASSKAPSPKMHQLHPHGKKFQRIKGDSNSQP